MKVLILIAFVKLEFSQFFDGLFNLLALLFSSLLILDALFSRLRFLGAWGDYFKLVGALRDFFGVVKAYVLLLRIISASFLLLGVFYKNRCLLASINSFRSRPLLLISNASFLDVFWWFLSINTFKVS